jgi:hypothetical protein
MTGHSEEQKLRKDTVENDRSVAREREQAATMHEFAMSEASLDLGRFNAIGKQRVIGGRPDVAAAYPAASAAHQVQLPNEPPLGFSVDQMPDLERPGFASPEAQAGPAPDAPPLVDSGEQRGVGPFSPSKEKPHE